MEVEAVEIFAELLTKAAERGSFEIMKGSGDLVAKRRYMMVTLVNKTEFDIHPVKTWFDSGRFWTAPAICNKMGRMGFSGCNKDWSIATGVSGVVLFNIRVGSKDHPLSVAFSNPMVGAVKCLAEFKSNYEVIWDRMNNAETYCDKIPIGNFKDTEGKSLSITLTSTSIPGMDAIVDITEQRNY